MPEATDMYDPPQYQNLKENSVGNGSVFADPPSYYAATHPNDTHRDEAHSESNGTISEYPSTGADCGITQSEYATPHSDTAIAHLETATPQPDYGIDRTDYEITHSDNARTRNEYDTNHTSGSINETHSEHENINSDSQAQNTQDNIDSGRESPVNRQISENDIREFSRPASPLSETDEDNVFSANEVFQEHQSCDANALFVPIAESNDSYSDVVINLENDEGSPPNIVVNESDGLEHREVEARAIVRTQSHEDLSRVINNNNNVSRLQPRVRRRSSDPESCSVRIRSSGSPGRYERRQQRSPDTRHFRKKRISRDVDELHVVSPKNENASPRDPLEIKDKKKSKFSVSKVALKLRPDSKEYPKPSEKSVIENGSSPKPVRSERQNKDNSQDSPQNKDTGKSKFTVTKVTSQISKFIPEVKNEQNGRAPNCKHRKPHIKVNIPNGNTKSKSDISKSEKENLALTPGDTSVINGENAVLEFKGDFLDADMLYEWTLDKKSKYAAQIRDVKMTLESRPPMPRDYIVLSLMVMFCCNLPFGIAALCLSLKISPTYENGKYKRARQFSKFSRILALAGIVLTIVLVVALLAVFWPKS